MINEFFNMLPAWIGPQLFGNRLPPNNQPKVVVAAAYNKLSSHTKRPERPKTAAKLNNNVVSNKNAFTTSNQVKNTQRGVPIIVMDKWDTLMNTEDSQHKPLVLRTDDTFQRKHVKEPVLEKFWKKSLGRWNQGESEWWWEKYEVGEKHSHSQYTASPVSYGGFGLWVCVAASGTADRNRMTSDVYRAVLSAQTQKTEQTWSDSK